MNFSSGSGVGLSRPVMFFVIFYLFESSHRVLETSLFFFCISTSSVRGHPPCLTKAPRGGCAQPRVGTSSLRAGIGIAGQQATRDGETSGLAWASRGGWGVRWAGSPWAPLTARVPGQPRSAVGAVVSCCGVGVGLVIGVSKQNGFGWVIGGWELLGAMTRRRPGHLLAVDESPSSRVDRAARGMGTSPEGSPA